MIAIIRGIKNRKIASAIIAIREITRRDNVDPLKGSMSITSSNIGFMARMIGIMSIHHATQNTVHEIQMGCDEELLLLPSL